MDKYGADGVQIASRFVLSKECSVSQEFKETYLRAHEQDIINVQSPVGMTGRAITTDFIRRLQAGEDVSPEKCKFQCLKKCSYKYCINDRLVASCNGDVDNGLVFCGANTYKINEILPVKEIFRQFVNDAESVYKENI